MFLDYRKVSMEGLVDLLAQETEKFTQLMAEKEFTKEYEECRENIKQFQAVIQARKGLSLSKHDLLQ